MDLQALFKEIHPNGTYQGWYKVFGDEQSKVDDVYTPNGNEETLYGKFGYVITFINEGQVFQTLFTTAGAKGNQLANLGNTPGNPGNYTWRGWTTKLDSSGQNVTTSYQFSGNTTVYAKWVSVINYYYNGTGGTDGWGGGNGSVDVIKGQSWNLPWAGGSSYTWKGWFWDAGFGSWAGDQNGVITPTGNATVYARWVSIVTYMNPYVSKFVVERYEVYGTLEVVKGQSTVLPRMPLLGTDDQFANLSFYTESNQGQMHQFNKGTKVGNYGQSYTPTGNITLYGQYYTP